MSENPVVLLETTSGDILVELYPDKAPETVANFLKYVDDGFYNNTIFHRVIPGFTIQGGGLTARMQQKDTSAPIKNEAVAHYKRIWETHGIGWICEEMGHSKLDGYTNVISYYGSSEYDTRQMSRLIDLIVMECKEQGIETMTPRELALLKEGWKNG
mgnify:CR=1 FL=1